MHAVHSSTSAFALRVKAIGFAEAFPSIDLQDRLAEILGIDRAKFTSTIQADRRYKMTQRSVPKGLPKSPIDRFWEQLNYEQRESIMCVAECFVRLNRKKQK